MTLHLTASEAQRLMKLLAWRVRFLNDGIGNTGALPFVERDPELERKLRERDQQDIEKRDVYQNILNRLQSHTGAA